MGNINDAMHSEILMLIGILYMKHLPQIKSYRRIHVLREYEKNAPVNILFSFIIIFNIIQQMKLGIMLQL